MRSRVALVVGPPEHGVVRHAAALAGTAGWPVVDRVDQVPTGALVVLDVTDRLWGSTAEVSGPALVATVDALHERDAVVVVSLHDVPFDGDGAVFARRAGVYRSLVQRSDAVLVASEVERVRLGALVPDLPAVAVVPLPVPASVTASSRVDGGQDRPLRSVTVLGFVYPGKGHAEVLAAMATLPADVPLVCVGRASDGHEDLVAAFAAADRPVQVTGFVPDDELATWLQGPTLPVAPNRVVSASGSLASWWAHGRRPLVPDVAYTREVGTDASVIRYDTDMVGPLHRAFLNPASTWLAPGVVPGSTLAEVAAARDAWLTRCFG